MNRITLNELLNTNKEEFFGKTICFITDTVWGIGAVIGKDFITAKDKIYEMKNRDYSKPLAILAPSIDEIKKHVKINDPKVQELMLKWPGALTIVFEKSDEYFDEVTQLPTVGLRIPNSKVALSILNYLGFMATTSVNISGSAPLNDKEEIVKYFEEYIDYLVVDEEPQSKTSSTVVDVTTSPWKILRQGDIVIK